MDEAERLIGEIASRAAEIDGLHSLLLLGSAARDELSYCLHPDGRVEFFSDLEFLLVTDHRPTGEQRRAWRQMAAEMEARVANPNPLFHIDAAWRELRRLATLPPIIFTFEMKANARLLHGEDVRPLLPDVTAANLDRANTREILFKRLWAILLHLPHRFLRGHPSERERQVMGYLLCRNLLDIPTVLLPHEGVLLPSYRRRVAFLREQWPALRMAAAFPATFPARLEEALERRRTLDLAQVDLVQAYGEVIAALERALAFLLEEGAGGVPPGTRLAELPRWSARFFNERPRSRGEWYGRAKLLARLVRCAGGGAAWRWMGLAHKGELTLGLLAMHRAALAYLRGEVSEASAAREEAEARLRRLWPCAALPTEGSFVERWLALRWEWGSFWRAFVRLGDLAYEARFRKVMEWEDGA